MQEKNPTDDDKEAPRSGKLNVLQKATGYWQSLSVRLSIEGELARRVARCHKTVGVMRPRAANKGLSRSEKIEAKRKPKERFLGRRLPRVLAEKIKPSSKKNSWLAFNDLVLRTAISIRGCIAPNEEDLELRDQVELRKIDEKYLACRELLGEAMLKEKNLKHDVENARRKADSHLRRAAKQEDSNSPATKRAHESSQEAISLENELNEHLLRYKIRLPVLHTRLAELEDQQHTIIIEKQLNKARSRVAESARQTERAMISWGHNAALHVVDRMEKKIAEREAQALAGIEALFGRGSEFKTDVCANTEQGVNQAEALLSILATKPADSPAAYPVPLDITEVRSAAEGLRRAAVELAKAYAMLLATKDYMQATLQRMHMQAEVWESRALISEKQGNDELVSSCRARKSAYLDSALEFQQTLARQRQAAEPIKLMLERVETIRRKLSALLREMEPPK